MQAVKIEIINVNIKKYKKNLKGYFIWYLKIIICCFKLLILINYIFPGLKYLNVILILYYYV